MSFSSWVSDIDPDSWKPEDNLDIVISFKKRGYKCGCGKDSHSWQYVREENLIEYNCAGPECVIGAYTEDNSYNGIFMEEIED